MKLTLQQAIERCKNERVDYPDIFTVDSGLIKIPELGV